MKLFAITDLCERWRYSRWGIHKLTKSAEFPQPITFVCRGRIKLFSEADIQNKPWLFDDNAKQQRRKLYAILQTVKGQANPQESLTKIFGQDAKPWKNR